VLCKATGDISFDGRWKCGPRDWDRWSDFGRPTRAGSSSGFNSAKSLMCRLSPLWRSST